MIDVKDLKNCISEIRKTTTVKIWARDKGFSYQTVILVLNGYTGKRQIGVTLDIINALEADGHLKKAA